VLFYYQLEIRQDFINNNMRLRSEMTIGGVIGAKSANEGDSVQPRRERGDFELEPVEGDGSIQSIASDGICTNPVGDGDGDQSGMLRNVQGQDIKCDLLYLAEPYKSPQCC